MTENQARKSDEFPYRTVKQIAEDPSYPFSEDSIRYWIHNADENGLRPAIRKLGKKLVINIKALEAWIDQKNSNDS